MMLEDNDRAERLQRIRDKETDLALIARLAGLLKTADSFSALYNAWKKAQPECANVREDTERHFREGDQPSMYIHNDIRNYVTVIRERYSTAPDAHPDLKAIYEVLEETCEPLGTNQRWYGDKGDGKGSGWDKAIAALDTLSAPEQQPKAKSFLSRLGF